MNGEHKKTAKLVENQFKTLGLFWASCEYQKWHEPNVDLIVSVLFKTKKS